MIRFIENCKIELLIRYLKNKVRDKQIVVTPRVSVIVPTVRDCVAHSSGTRPTRGDPSVDYRQPTTAQRRSVVGSSPALRSRPLDVSQPLQLLRI